MIPQHHYRFVSIWHIPSPLTPIWDALLHIEKWPEWWQGVEMASIVQQPKNADGTGAEVIMKWKSWLPYTINFHLTVVEAIPGERLVGKAQGDLDGTGTWEFDTSSQNQTTLTYTWDVSTTKPWMNFLAPIGRLIFSHAHHVLMRRGERGLVKYLQTKA